MSSTFTALEEERLIAAVKERPIIYDQSSKAYKDRTAKDNAWDTVASLVGRSATECQTRWRTLRDSYFKNKKKKKTGSAATKSSKYDLINLQFLDSFHFERPTLTNILGLPTNVPSPSEDSNNPIETDNSSLNTEETLPSISVEDPISDDERDRGFSSSPEVKHKKKPAVTTRNNILKEIRQSRQERLQLFEKVLGKTEENIPVHPITHFFKSIEEIIKNFPESDIREVRNQIYHIVSRKEEDLAARKESSKSDHIDHFENYILDPETGQLVSHQD